MLKIAVPICNRTNYSKLRPVLRNLENLGGQFSIILSSGIVVPRYGDAKKDIRRDFNVDWEVDCLLANDTTQSMCKNMGLSMIEHSSIYARDSIGALLVIGDRFDILPPVMSAKVMNIPILHIQGGERSGSIDDTVRNMITVCSSRHYVATEKAKENVFVMTDSEHVYNFGCPAVEAAVLCKHFDTLDSSKFVKKFDHLDISENEEYFLIMVHPNTEDENDVCMDTIMRASLSFGVKCIVIYPNIDAYNGPIVDSIRHNKDRCVCVKHFSFEDFIQTMSHAKCVIGNSSAGIRESASFGVPMVNVGHRQDNREKNCNTIDCPCNERSIIESIQHSISVNHSKKNIYYQPNASQRIAENILEFQNARI